MADAVGTGHGATIAFTTSSTFVGSYISIGGFSVERPALKTSYLGTVGYDTFIPGDLAEVSEFECEMFFAYGQVLPPITADPEIVTITLPESTSVGQPATIAEATAATGAFVVGYTMPTLMTNELMRMTVRVHWVDHPTWTAETDV